MQQWFLGTQVLKVFRYVHDFLALLQCGALGLRCELSQIVGTFEERLSPLVITHEISHEDSLQFSKTSKCMRTH